MECGFGAGNILPAVRRASEALAGTQAERRELYVISDMQQTAWPEVAPDPVFGGVRSFMEDGVEI